MLFNLNRKTQQKYWTPNAKLITFEYFKIKIQKLRDKRQFHQKHR